MRPGGKADARPCGVAAELARLRSTTAEAVAASAADAYRVLVGGSRSSASGMGQTVG